MTIRVPVLRRKARFQRSTAMAEASNTPKASPSEESGHQHAHTHHHHHHHHDHSHSHHDQPSLEEQVEKMTLRSVPALYTSPPSIKDELKTPTSKVQDETVQQLLPFLTLSHILDASIDLNKFDLPKLRRRTHQGYLKFMLEAKYPPNFVGLDPSRPWTFYWCINGLAMLGVDVSTYSDKYEKIENIQSRGLMIN
jgi:hypothetical protein